jgi:hypothetical protein
MTRVASTPCREIQDRFKNLPRSRQGIDVFEHQAEHPAVKPSLAIPLGGACVAGLVVALALPSRCPLDVTFAKMEPSGVLDDTGKELVFATLAISNHAAETIYFAREWIKVDTKIANKWTEIENREYLGALSQHRTNDLVVLTSANGCRLHLKYAPASLQWRLVQHAGTFGARLQFRYWHFFNPPQGRNPHWRQKTFELEFPKGAGASV